MDRYFPPIIFIVALLWGNSSTAERVNINSGSIAISSEKTVAQSTTPLSLVSNTANSSLLAAPDSTPASFLEPTTESLSLPNRASKGKVIQITDRNYKKKVERSRIPVLIHFWAPWSVPDRLLKPIIEAVANEYTGRVKIGKVNVDKNPKLAQKFGIKGIPTIIVIMDGREQQRKVGATSKEQISRMLDQQLGSNP